MVSKKLTKTALGISWDVLTNSQRLANEGKGLKEIIEQLPEGTKIMLSEGAIVFFMEGSVPMLVELPAKPNFKITKGTPTGSASLADNLLEEQDVIANKRGDPEREYKKALILSPFLDEFKADDDGLVAYNYLKENKNYKEGITFLKNRKSIEDILIYTTFADYDLVHLSTHGRKFCINPITKKKDYSGEMVFEIDDFTEETFALEDIFDENDALTVFDAITGEEQDTNYNVFLDNISCSTLIQTGIEHGLDFKNLERFIEFLEDPDSNAPHLVFGWKKIHLKASFFSQYGVLNDKLWIFSACEMGQKDDLVQVMQNTHKNGSFLYWSNAVNPKDAYKAFDKFYENLAKEGLDIENSFDKIPDELKSNLESSIDVRKESEYHEIAATTDLKLLASEKPRHAVEIVDLRHPITGLQLVDGNLLPIAGDFGDEKQERIPLKLQLIGYKKHEFEKMTLSIKTDGYVTSIFKKKFINVPPDPNMKISSIAGVEHGIELSFDEILIPDLKKDQEKLELKAYLHFNDNRFSVHTVSVIVNPKDVKVSGHGPKGSFTITHDYDAQATKMQASSAPSDVFSDANGYIHAYDPKEGWQKINISYFLSKNFQKRIGEIVGNSIAKDLVSEIGLDTKADKASLFRQITNWPNQITITKLTNSDAFSKSEITCSNSIGKCFQFRGIAKETKGVVIKFNSNNKLQKMTVKGQILDFKYGDFKVVLPSSRERSLF